MDQHIDAESLAAYMEGTLSRRERAAAEAHAADCPRCLHLLAAMARTEESSQARRSAWSLPVVRWSVPLLAGATALALWINVRPHRPFESVPPPPTSEDVSLPAVSTPAPEADRPASSVEGLERQGAKSDETKTRADQQSAGAAPQRVTSADALQSRTLPDTATSAPAAPAATPNAGATAPQPLEKRSNLRFEDTLGETAAARVAMPTLEIASPDSMTRWRVEGKTILRSTDGGKTWNSESVPVEREVTAGSSPSPLVAWLVGRQGYILRTSATNQWRRVPFPEPADLASVSARSEREAEVTTSDGRVFATVDGGQTWQRR